MKKVLSILLVVLLLVLIVPENVIVVKAEEFTENYFTYTITDSKATITAYDKYNGVKGELIIPSTLGECYVTEIGDRVFYNNNNITSVVIPNTVKKIGESAFSLCNNLESIVIPPSLQETGNYVFKDTDIKKVYITDLLAWCNIDFGTYISGYGPLCRGYGKLYLNNTLITELKIPEDVTSIEVDTFRGCDSIVSVVLPKSITNISDAFRGCTNIKDVWYLGSETDKAKISISDSDKYLLNATWHFDSCPIGAEHTYDTKCDENCNNCDEIRIAHEYTNELDVDCDLCGKTRIVTGKTGDCTWSLDGTVLTISGEGKTDKYGFESTLPWGTNITEVIIEQGVETISQYAFYNCNRLTSVTIPDSVTSIERNTFAYCTSLESIVIPNSVTNIGQSLFYECTNLTNVTLSRNLTSIGRSAFMNCHSLTSISIPNGVASIEGTAFHNCKSLTSIIIPDSVTNIGNSAFFSCDDLIDVWYRGSEESSQNIEIGTANGSLTDAQWHYNTCENHVYSSDCDITCNACDWMRTGIADHSYTWVVDIQETCGVDGSKYEECILCNATRNANTVIPATGNHIYDNACDVDCNVCFQVREVPDHIYENSCDTTCNVCGNLREIIHDYEWVIDIENNCGQFGIKHEECTVCHVKRNELTAIPATKNHTYANDCDSDCDICGLVRIPATHIYDNACDTDCDICGETREIEHRLKWVTDMAANCGDKGAKHEECTVCGTKQNENTAIDATGKHKYDNNCDTSCNVCKQTRKITHTYTTKTTKATTKKNGSIVKQCSVCGKTTGSKTTIYHAKKVKLSTTEYTYNGKAKKPSIKLYDSKGNKISSGNYEVSYKNNKKVGKATATIKLKGKYSGTIKAYFTIVPKESKVSKLTAAKKSLKVKLKKVSSESSGYEIQYSTSSKFKSAKTKKVTSYKTTSVTLKSLKAKKTYYVRVRTYKTVSGKKYYSDWSSKKSKKTK